jgi:Zn-dependent peptidase ImmA (M78 family)/DNA-binding XRE family transcriptional regulator
MSIGERLKIARTLAGLSQRDLAERAEVSAMAISKYERDQDTPSSPVLIRLAQSLGVKVEYFFRPVEVKLTAPAYRKRMALSEHERGRILARIQEWIERYIEVEILLDLESRVDLPEPYPVRTLPDAEDAALRIRDHWAIGHDPIENMIALFEDRGIKVGLVDGPEEFDALTLRANETIPMIAVKRGIPGDRQRFCLAHELGHVWLDIADSLDEERVVNRFAGAFIVPQAAVLAELGDQRRRLDIYELHLLKHKYGLSMRAWVYRAKDLGVLSEAAAVQWFKTFNQHGWHRREPGDALQAEEPLRFQRLVVRGLAEDLISPARAAELLGRPLSEFWREEAARHGGLPLPVRD